MKKGIATAALLLYAAASFACSTFLLHKNGRLVFGRNYDWVTGNGMMLINARGVKKTSLVGPGEKPVIWTAQCGSITFNQFGKNFPHGGMNESGLVVEMMWLAGTVYPAQDDRPVLNELQWIQYQLDNFTTVADVIAASSSVRIKPQGAAPLHFLVADAQGHAATIEFIDGEMVVHQGKELVYPVLTNTDYATSLRTVAQKDASVSSDNSLSRFATACKMMQQFQQAETKEEPVPYAFGILDKVAQGNFTKWRVVYDITNRTVYFESNGPRRAVSFDAFDFTCTGRPLYLDLYTKKEGKAATLFTPLSFEQNKKVLLQSAAESGSRLDISPESMQAAVAYFNQGECVE